MVKTSPRLLPQDVTREVLALKICRSLLTTTELVHSVSAYPIDSAPIDGVRMVLRSEVSEQKRKRSFQKFSEVPEVFRSSYETHSVPKRFATM